MARALRWALAFLGAVFLTGLLLYCALWAAAGFAGEIRAVILGPLLMTPIIGALLFLPALAADLLLAGTAWDRVSVYAGAGTFAVFLVLVALIWFHESTADEDQTIGIVVFALLGAVGGALFRVFRGERA